MNASTASSGVIGMPTSVRQTRQHAVGDRLGVDQDPVAVEDDGADQEMRTAGPFSSWSARGTRPARSPRTSSARAADARGAGIRPRAPEADLHGQLPAPARAARARPGRPRAAAQPGRGAERLGAARRRVGRRLGGGSWPLVIDVKYAQVSNRPSRARSVGAGDARACRACRSPRASHDPRRHAALDHLDAAEAALDEPAELRAGAASASSGSGPSGGAARRRRRGRRPTAATASARCPSDEFSMFSVRPPEVEKK